MNCSYKRVFGKIYIKKTVLHCLKSQEPNTYLSKRCIYCVSYFQKKLLVTIVSFSINRLVIHYDECKFYYTENNASNFFSIPHCLLMENAVQEEPLLEKHYGIFVSSERIINLHFYIFEHGSRELTNTHWNLFWQDFQHSHESNKSKINFHFHVDK